MSDPLRDAAARQKGDKRESIRRKYTPIVLWVDAPEDKRIHDVRDWVEGELEDLPYVDVATYPVPYWFATDGVGRVEDADGNGDIDE